MYNTYNTYKPLLLFIVTALIASSSCRDIIEPNLTGKKVVLISPSDSIRTTDSSIQFDWEDMEDAYYYRLQIARPDFNQIERLVYDTLITENSVTFSLYPGYFQWRIRPENSSSYGEYITRTLQIDSTLDLSGQQVILQTPLSGIVTNDSTLTFSWYDLYNASQYSFMIKTPDWNGALLLPEVTTTNNFVVIENIPEGTYTWGVRGVGTLSNTPYSTRTFSTDFTSPVAPTLVTPLSSATVTSPFTLRWQRPVDEGSQLSDSVFIYSDSPFMDITWSESSSADSISKSLTSGTYYWRVKEIDAAGNTGPFSESRTFYVQ